ncbi:MAG: hypothetical protein ABR501_01910 [Pyrinomonadaceae bacterium]
MAISARVRWLKTHKFPDWYAFGDPNGIGNKYKDKDTGARLEKCIFKTVLY